MKEVQVRAALKALPGLGRKELVQQFKVVYKKDPPLRLSDRILALAIAYRMQEQLYGGLKPATRRALLSGAAPARKIAGPGSVLIRQWQGREHTVYVHADGVEYQGQRLRSLTEVAFKITGQKRSGPAFFGLKSKRSV